MRETSRGGPRFLHCGPGAEGRRGQNTKQDLRTPPKTSHQHHDSLRTPQENTTTKAEPGVTEGRRTLAKAKALLGFLFILLRGKGQMRYDLPTSVPHRRPVWFTQTVFVQGNRLQNHDMVPQEAIRNAASYERDWRRLFPDRDNIPRRARKPHRRRIARKQNGCLSPDLLIYCSRLS